MFEIKENSPLGIAAEGEIATVSVTKDGDANMFVRNAIRMNGGGHYRTLVAELDGVRCYVRERDGKVHVFMTKQDLYE